MQQLPGAWCFGLQTQELHRFTRGYGRPGDTESFSLQRSSLRAKLLLWLLNGIASLPCLQEIAHLFLQPLLDVQLFGN